MLFRNLQKAVKAAGRGGKIIVLPSDTALDGGARLLDGQRLIGRGPKVSDPSFDTAKPHAQITNSTIGPDAPDLSQCLVRAQPIGPRVVAEDVVKCSKKTGDAIVLADNNVIANIHFVDSQRAAICGSVQGKGHFKKHSSSKIRANLFTGWNQGAYRTTLRIQGDRDNPPDELPGETSFPAIFIGTGVNQNGTGVNQHRSDKLLHNVFRDATSSGAQLKFEGKSSGRVVIRGNVLKDVARMNIATECMVLEDGSKIPVFDTVGTGFAPTTEDMAHVATVFRDNIVADYGSVRLVGADPVEPTNTGSNSNAFFPSSNDDSSQDIYIDNYHWRNDAGVGGTTPGGRATGFEVLTGTLAEGIQVKLTFLNSTFNEGVSVEDIIKAPDVENIHLMNKEGGNDFEDPNNLIANIAVKVENIRTTSVRSGMLIFPGGNANSYTVDINNSVFTGVSEKMVQTDSGPEDACVASLANTVADPRRDLIFIVPSANFFSKSQTIGKIAVHVNNSIMQNSCRRGVSMIPGSVTITEKFDVSVENSDILESKDANIIFLPFNDFAGFPPTINELNIDFGGGVLGSVGNNRVLKGNLPTSYQVGIRNFSPDFNVKPVKIIAQHNWWGSKEGIGKCEGNFPSDPDDVCILFPEDVGIIDASDPLTEDPCPGGRQYNPLTGKVFCPQVEECNDHDDDDE